MSNSDYQVRTYVEGDESALLSLFNQYYGRYAGFVQRTLQDWLWYYKLHPDIGPEGILVVNKGKEIVGYAAIGRLGLRGNVLLVYELCYDPTHDGQTIISKLLKKAEQLARDRNGSYITFDAPSDDTLIRKICEESGFIEGPREKVLGFVVLDIVSLIEQIIKSRKERWREGNEAFLIRLKDVPPPNNIIAIRWMNGKPSISNKVSTKSRVVIDTDLSILKRLIFGEDSILKVLLKSKLAIRPLWKIRSGIRFLSLLLLRDRWYIPRYRPVWWYKPMDRWYKPRSSAMISRTDDSMRERNYIIRTYREGDEEGIVEMYRNGSSREIDIEHWTWRNKLSPYFDPSLVFIAEENGKMIACGQAQLRNLKINQSLTVKASQGVNLVVRREHRRRGVATEMMYLVRRRLRDKGAIIHYGITLPWTHKRVYTKRGGTLTSRNLFCNTEYVKFLNCASLKQKALVVNEVLSEYHDLRSKLMDLDLTILFHLKAFPPFALKVRQGEISVEEGEPIASPNVVITASALSTGMFTLMKMFFSGEVKIRGLLHNFLSLYRFFKVMRKVNRIIESSTERARALLDN